MPNHVESRADLPIHRLVATFLAETRTEDPPLHKTISQLDDEGIRSLAGILGRFDERGDGQLDPAGRLQARRVVGRLRKPKASSLALMNRVLDYLDLNENGTLEDKELRLATDLFEAFQTAESDNDTLSDRELELLYAVLRGLDQDHDGRLSRKEREGLAVILAESQEGKAR
jgi:hypothetical protein